MTKKRMKYFVLFNSAISLFFPSPFLFDHLTHGIDSLSTMHRQFIDSIAIMHRQFVDNISTLKYYVRLSNAHQHASGTSERSYRRTVFVFECLSFVAVKSNKHTPAICPKNIRNIEKYGKIPKICK